MLPADQLSELLRGLEPLQEKVVRLRYGLGCQRRHSPREIARAFQVPPEVIRGILREAHQRLANAGWAPGQLRAAAGGSHEAGADVQLGRLSKARSCRGRLS